MSSKLKEIYPDSKFGVLIMKNVNNPATCEKFNEIKSQVISHIRNTNEGYNRMIFSFVTMKV